MNPEKTPAAKKPAAKSKSKPADPLQAAMEYEQAIADEAAKIRADHYGGKDAAFGGMDAALFVKLWPLLRRPIPAGFITTTPKVKGKPYESTGIRSVQVCTDRMDAVLTPLAWTIEDEYENNGKLCRVTVTVLSAKGEGLVRRSSYGGMDHASTGGNLMKGSFTNAAKRAFGLIGVGHEVYLGAADGDPDTDESAAAEQGKAANRERRTTKAPQNTPPAPSVPPDHALAELLAKDDDLSALRKRADDGMKIVGAKAGQRLRELQAAKTEADLVSLINRIDATLDA